MTTPTFSSTPAIASFFPNVTLTQDQVAALHAFEQFMADDSQTVFILRGYAGTGKTFLMQGVAQWLRQRNYDLLFTAPTGRAAKVLQHSTGVQASTVHRAIYKFASEDAHTFQVQFDLSKRDTNHAPEQGEKAETRPLVMVVDEASMLGDVAAESDEQAGAKYGSGRLLADYLRHADFEHHPGTKMVLVGDDAQLPPVGMSFSPALSADYLFLEYGIRPVVAELRMVVRQKEGSDLLATATAMREALERSSMTKRVPIIQTCADGGIRRLPADQFSSTYVRLNGKPRPTGQVVILAHTNEDVTRYNAEIREHYFSGHTGSVAEGDILVVGHNVYTGPHQLSNGEIIRVVEVGRRREATIQAPRGKIAAEASGLVTYTAETVSARFVWVHITAEVRLGTGQIARFQTVLLESALFHSKAELPWAAIYLMRREAQDRFYHANKLLYKTDKKEFERLRDVQLRTDVYANALRCRFGYAITCHKAQGGEWKHVLADMRNIMQHFDDLREYYRWAYTAVTRARVCVWLGFVETQTKHKPTEPVTDARSSHMPNLKRGALPLEPKRLEKPVAWAVRDDTA